MYFQGFFIKGGENIFFDVPKVDLTKTQNTSFSVYNKIYNNLL